MDDKNNTLTLESMAEELSALTGMSVKMSYRYLSGVFEMISDAIAKGRKVKIKDVGIFFVRKTKPRIGRNIRTGEPVEIPERETVKFTPSKKLTDRLQGTLNGRDK